MARANPFDPKVSSVTSVLYVTPSSNEIGIRLAYPLSGQQTLSELSPKGAIARASTLSTTPPW